MSGGVRRPAAADTIRAMTWIEPWSDAALRVGRGPRRRPELAPLPVSRLPTLAELFTFARDAELRFETLRMRIEEVTATTRGEHLMSIEVLLRHPGHARVTTTEPGGAARANYE